MLSIIICEDNNIQRNKIQNTIETQLINLNIGISVDLSTGNPKDVIDYIKKNSNRSFIYFLDVDLNAEINGVELAKDIRKYDIKGYIVFITSHEEFSLLTFKYKVQALDYILKTDDDILRKNISECLSEIYNNYKRIRSSERETISIKCGSRITNFYMDEILFFETTEIDHILRIHTEKGFYEFYGKLKDIEKQVSAEYYKSHRSYLVNTSKIKSIDTKELIIYMVNGDTCLISKRNLKGLMSICAI